MRELLPSLVWVMWQMPHKRDGCTNAYYMQWTLNRIMHADNVPFCILSWQLIALFNILWTKTFSILTQLKLNEVVVGTRHLFLDLADGNDICTAQVTPPSFHSGLKAKNVSIHK